MSVRFRQVPRSALVVVSAADEELTRPEAFVVDAVARAIYQRDREAVAKQGLGWPTFDSAGDEVRSTFRADAHRLLFRAGVVGA